MADEPTVPAADAPAPDAEATPVAEPSVPTDAPAEAPKDGAEAPVEETLYELPDGRKVDAETLQKEWKENFAPEFTRKSQKLAEYEKINNPTPDGTPEWQKEDYVPKSYGELIETAKNSIREDMKADATKEADRIKGVQDQVSDTLKELKEADPDLDENQLFEHANKYKFGDLKVAYENMNAMKGIVKSTEKRVVKNINQRNADPINTGGGEPDVDEGYDPVANSVFSGAVDFLQRMKKD